MDFSIALNDLNPDSVFQLINTARPSSDYLFNTLLPERNMPNYYVDAANMVIRTTAAGLSGESSPYPPGGAITASQFLEKSAKISLASTFEESALKQIQEILQRAGTGSSGSKQFLVNEALNWYQKVNVQGHFDRAEMLRARALIDGAIDWTFNDKNLNVDYGVPGSFKPATQTGTSGYGGTSSKFWADHRKAIQALRYNVRAIIMHSDTWDVILSNSVNAIQVATQNGNAFTIQRYVTVGGNTVISSDSRDRITIITYDREYEELDPANPGTTIRKSFVKPGEILYVANNQSSGYVVGQGASRDPIAEAALGYHHIAPTVEGNGAPGRWGRIYVPESAQWSIRTESAENSLPVRTDVGANECKTYTLKTELPAT